MDAADVMGAWASAEAVRVAVVARRVTAVDVVAAALRRAIGGDDQLRAFVAVRGEEAITEAAAVDAALAEGGAAPRWAGVPIAVKGSAGVHGQAAGLDSEQARRLRSAGAVVVGVTAIPRGGGPQTWGFTDRGPTRNPWAPQLSPGGSSAGSAAAVAAGVVPVACGSDGAGSARIPAAWCGIFGYKPTTALVARLDESGLGVPAPLARDPRDLAGWAEIVIGALPSTDPPVRACWSADLGYAAAELDPAVAAIAHDAAERLVSSAGLGWTVGGVELVDPAAAWSTLRDPHAGVEARRQAKALRSENDHRLDEVFGRYDLLFNTATTAPAPT